jgi:hypothetical protein
VPFTRADCPAGQVADFAGEAEGARSLNPQVKVHSRVPEPDRVFPGPLCRMLW